MNFMFGFRNKHPPEDRYRKFKTIFFFFFFDKQKSKQNQKKIPQKFFQSRNQKTAEIKMIFKNLHKQKIEITSYFCFN